MPYLLDISFVANETKASSFRFYDRLSTFKRLDKPSFRLSSRLVWSFLFFATSLIIHTREASKAKRLRWISEICGSRLNGDCFYTACHLCELYLHCNCCLYLSSCTASALHCIRKKVETVTASCRNSYCTNYTSYHSFLSRRFQKHSKNTIFW